MNAVEVVLAVRKHYGSGWAVVEQVANGTGSGAGRWLDLVAFGLWPSRGLEIHGIEVKISRNDLSREFAKPAKADAIARWCDRFWLATPAGIVDPFALDTVAPTWGLLEVDKAGRVQTRRPAAQLAPAPLDRQFVAAVMRRMPSPTDALRAEIEATVRADMEAQIEARAQLVAQRNGDRWGRMADRVEAFIAASGIDFVDPDWASPFGRQKPEDVAAAVAFILTESGERWSTMTGRLNDAAEALDRHAGQFTDIATRIRALAPSVKVEP